MNNTPEGIGLKFLYWAIKKDLITFYQVHILKWFRKKPDPLVNPKTTLECLQQYAEKVVIDSGINLDNVIVHNLGQFGLAGKTQGWETYTINNGFRYDFKIPHSNTPYIVVPEIKGVWEFRAWLHEVGHFIKKHYKSNKPTYYQEYEAEVYCLKMARSCPHVDDFIYYEIWESAIQYLGGHVKEAINLGIITSYKDIPLEVLDFFGDSTDARQQFKEMLRASSFSNDMDEFMSKVRDEVDKAMEEFMIEVCEDIKDTVDKANEESEERHRKFDRYYR